MLLGTFWSTPFTAIQTSGQKYNYLQGIIIMQLALPKIL